MKFATIMMVAASSATTKVVLNCKTKEVQYGFEGVLRKMTTQTLAQGAAEAKTFKTKTAAAKAEVAKSKKLLDTCYGVVHAITPANKTTANGNKCSTNYHAFADATKGLNNYTCADKVLTMKPAQFSTIPATFGLTGAAKIAAPKAVCPALTKAQIKTRTTAYKKTKGSQQLEIATADKRAAAAEMLYKLSVVDLNACYVTNDATTPALKKAADVDEYKCELYKKASAHFAAIYGIQECAFKAASSIKMGGDTTLIIIIAVVVVLCCCVGGFMYKKHSEKSGEGEGTTVNEFNTDLYTAFIDQETA